MYLYEWTRNEIQFVTRLSIWYERNSHLNNQEKRAMKKAMWCGWNTSARSSLELISFLSCSVESLTSFISLNNFLTIMLMRVHWVPKASKVEKSALPASISVEALLAGSGESKSITIWSVLQQLASLWAPAPLSWECSRPELSGRDGLLWIQKAPGSVPDICSYNWERPLPGTLKSNYQCVLTIIMDWIGTRQLYIKYTICKICWLISQWSRKNKDPQHQWTSCPRNGVSWDWRTTSGNPDPRAASKVPLPPTKVAAATNSPEAPRASAISFSPLKALWSLRRTFKQYFWFSWRSQN